MGDKNLTNPSFEEGVSMSSRGLDHYSDKGAVNADIRGSNISSNGEIKKGMFVVVDGLDGIGKGEIERALVAYEQMKGKAVFDSISFSKAYEELPELNNFWGVPRPHFNTIITAEPTYAWIGKAIREEITLRNLRDYPARVQVETYSNDRLIQMMRVVVPALNHGINVIQSRCMASTLTYQLLKSRDEGEEESKILEEILNHPGNRYQSENRPDLLIIPTIESARQLEERLRERGKNEKDDRSMFENVQFQERLKPLYESGMLRDIFEKLRTKVSYINAGLGIESSRGQAVDIYKGFLEGEVKEIYRTPESVLGNTSDRISS